MYADEEKVKASFKEVKRELNYVFIGGILVFLALVVLGVQIFSGVN